jgi:hypothetical protein
VAPEAGGADAGLQVRFAGHKLVRPGGRFYESVSTVIHGQSLT